METLQNYLKNYFEFNDKEIKHILDKIITRNVESIKNRVTFYMQSFDINKNQLAKMIHHLPTMLELDTNSNNSTSIKAKVEFYKNIFGIGNAELSKIFQRMPALLAYDTVSPSPTSIKSKIEFYKQTLNLNDKDLQLFLRKSPQLLSLDTNSNSPTSVKSKLNFYKDWLGLNEKELVKTITALPSLLGYDTISNDPTSIKSKMEFYKKTFGVNDKELRSMIKLMPTLLCLDTTSNKPTSFNQKIEILDSLGIDRKTVAKNPLILSTPAKALKIRIMLRAVYYGYTQSFATGLMMNENKVYARGKFIENNPKIAKSLIYNSTKRFSNKTKTTDASLLDQYILTRETAKEIEKTYNETAEKQIHLTETELSQYPKEVEVE